MTKRKATIYKHTFSIVVLNDRPEYDPDLEGLALDIDTGDAIGQYTKESTDIVPPRRVRAELLDVGNDGTFFDVGY